MKGKDKPTFTLAIAETQPPNRDFHDLAGGRNNGFISKF